MDYKEMLEEQINLLIKWNKVNIEKEPEQVRENLKVILQVLGYLEYLPGLSK